MPQLPDPVLICRNILLGRPSVTDLVGDQVFATPLLPKEHSYPLVRLTHVGSTGYAPVAFRHSAVALVQVDIWAASQPEMHAIREAVLDTLQGQPPIGSGATRITPTSESVTLDESLQPPMYRCRADLNVTIVAPASLAINP